jgi:hypothetical protein
LPAMLRQGGQQRLALQLQGRLSLKRLDLRFGLLDLRLVNFGERLADLVFGQTSPGRTRLLRSPSARCGSRPRLSRKVAAPYSVAATSIAFGGSALPSRPPRGEKVDTRGFRPWRQK